MSLERSADRIYVELADGLARPLLWMGAIALVVGLGLAAYATILGVQREIGAMTYPKQPLPSEPAVEVLPDRAVDCSLDPFNTYCDDVRPKIVASLPTPTQVYISRIDQHRPLAEQAPAVASPTIPAEVEDLMGEGPAWWLETLANERDWSSEYPQGRDTWSMPEPNLSPHDPDLEIHIDALERARLTRANIRGLWDAHYEVEQNAFARAHPSATWPHRDDVFLRTAGHDAWVVAFASRQAQPQRHMSGVPAMRAARTSVGVLFAALLFGLLGVRRQRGIYIAVSSLGIEVDGQRVPADDIEDVLITGGRFVVVTHGGEFVRSRVLPDPFAAHEILEAAKQQRSTLTEHYEAQTAEANLQGAAARLRERA